MLEKIHYGPPRAHASSNWRRCAVTPSFTEKKIQRELWLSSSHQKAKGQLQEGALSQHEATFRQLVDEWRRATAMHSQLQKKVIHPAYQRIIGMGPTAIPLILREMKQRPGHWFWALDAITQGDAPKESWETLEQATSAWIRWGESKGYL